MLRTLGVLEIHSLRCGPWGGPRDGEIEQRVNALIARMNLDEKIYAHLNTGRPAAATELGIPIGQSRRFEARSRCGSQELEQAWQRMGTRSIFAGNPIAFGAKRTTGDTVSSSLVRSLHGNSDMRLMRWRGGPSLVMVAAVLGGAGPAGAQGSYHATLAGGRPLPALSASQEAQKPTSVV